jgi:chloramphenicol-sensitive protein RarD
LTNVLTATASNRQKSGVAYALAAYSFWGLLPIYFKAVQPVTSMEILAHRIIWSVPVTALLISLGRDWKSLKTALVSKKVVGTLLLTALLVASLWLVFIFAVNSNHLLQASLGYYINPLVNVLLGVIFLKERLSFFQITAVILAAFGTANLTFHYGEFPWIALLLALTGGFYGLLRKTVQIESVNGLFVETCLISPFALAFLIYSALQGHMIFGTADYQTTGLLMLAGAITVFPMVWFTCAARRLRYSTMGLLQYVSPSLMFALAVFQYHEPITPAKFITFLFIWTALAVFMIDSLKVQKKNAPGS